LQIDDADQANHVSVSEFLLAKLEQLRPVDPVRIGELIESIKQAR
jgi:hypothetical protein